MSVLVFTSFRDVPTQIREPLAYPRQPNFFLSFDWFALLFQTSLRDSISPRIYVVLNHQGTLVGGMFCGVRKTRILRTLTSLTNFYTVEYGPTLVSRAVDEQH